jgi:hypothetical protein
MDQKFRTTEAYITGAVCGSMWWPNVLGGKPFRADLRPLFKRFATDDVSLRDALLLYLSENGGDFQNAEFTADTRIVVIRKRVDGPSRYTTHVREREVLDMPTVADLVNADTYTGDFLGDDE